MTNYKNEKVVIIGLGITGISCVNFFLYHGVIPRVINTNYMPENLDELSTNVPIYLGSFKECWLYNVTLIVVSPGIPRSHPALVMAEDRNISVISDIELFAREVLVPVVAITGSNGKSTVTSLVGKMAASAGYKVGVGGNIGYPALMLLNSPYQLCVLELSSFQLETTYSLKTVAATVLNISKDHMDRYPLGLQQYRAAKLKIYQDAKVCVINANDVLTLPVSKNDSRYVSFGEEYGDYYLSRRNSKTCLMAYGEFILNCDDMIMIGYHNYTNALAALALADIIGIPRTNSLTVLKQFKGLAHRFEVVYEQHGIRWINDSKSTNIGSTKAALNGIKVAGTLHLLLGGDGKDSDFTVLTPWLQKDRIRLYCFGRDGVQLASLRPDIATLTDTLEQAMCIIGTRVRTGDLVLLSPACASFDQFSDFTVRGQVFTRLAREIGSCV